MIFQQFRAGGGLSYLIGCERSHAAALVDPEISLLLCRRGGRRRTAGSSTSSTRTRTPTTSRRPTPWRSACPSPQ